MCMCGIYMLTSQLSPDNIITATAPGHAELYVRLNHSVHIVLFISEESVAAAAR